MRLVRLDPAPAMLSSAIVMGSTTDFAAATGESPLRFRRMDRYAALGYTAAYTALARAGIVPRERGDASWGILLGSSTGCWASNAEFFRDLGRLRPPELSPAVFARTVSNAVNGEISIARQIGGVNQTYVSGWTAGAEAIAEAGSLIAEGRSSWVLAGGVEAPDDTVRALHAAARAERGDLRAPAPLEEAAGVLLLGRADATTPTGRPRLIAFARGGDPRGAWSLAETVRHTGTRAGLIVVCGAVPPELFGRWRAEVPDVELCSVRPELGAAGAVAGIERCGSTPSLVVVRGWDGAIVVLALAP